MSYVANIKITVLPRSPGSVAGSGSYAYSPMPGSPGCASCGTGSGAASSDNLWGQFSYQFGAVGQLHRMQL